jgi:ABC-type transporter Mla maintaining outer membrane lipid asymmetry ATPase subunit MlaF
VSRPAFYPASRVAHQSHCPAAWPTLAIPPGGSGAGKTTLADVLCGRKTVGEVQGDILVNGYPKDQASWCGRWALRTGMLYPCLA